MRLPVPILLSSLAVLTATVSGPAQDAGFDRNIAAGAHVRPPTTFVEPAGCSTTECHPGIKEHTELHGPLQVDACDACHVLQDVASHSFGSRLPRQQLCLACHEPPRNEDGLKVHEPVVQGECQACHDPHGSEWPRAILRADRAAMCLECHSDLTDGQPLAHAPESQGACNACHNAHSSTLDSLLLRPGRALCLPCHVEIAEQLAVSGLAHPPATDDCRLCHDPHASGDAALLIGEPVTMCTRCHEGVAHEMEGATHPHAAMTAEKACVNCHQPHASDHGSLLRGPTAELCFQCHAEQVERQDGPAIPSIEAKLRDSKRTHGPAARGECTLCHQVHGGERDRLLTSEYAGVYSITNDASGYSLCFDCHDRNLALIERTTAITSFRNGDRNLHHVHLSGAKGRSCNICHDPHASDSERLMRAVFPFGLMRWELPIGWQGTETGGGCVGACHAPFDYDRLNPIEYVRAPAGDGKWRTHPPVDSKDR